MRTLHFAAAALLCMTAIPAFAQTPAGADLGTGARPGHQPGDGSSLPKSNNSSNIAPAGTRAGIAPTLPPSPIGENASSFDYLRSARGSLAAGRTGQAQESLEMAETRALDRSVVQGLGSMPSDSKLVAQIHSALEALGTGNTARAIQIIDQALAG
jgi:hypothetical protein